MNFNSLLFRLIQQGVLSLCNTHSQTIRKHFRHCWLELAIWLLKKDTSYLTKIVYMFIYVKILFEWVYVSAFSLLNLSSLRQSSMGP